MTQRETELMQLFTMVAMKLTSRIVDYSYQDMKIGRLIFIINYIGYKEQCTMKDIIDYLNTKPSTATRQLDKLVNDLKLVSREQTSDDRRFVSLKLTKLGKEVYESHTAMSLIPASILNEKFSEKEIAIMKQGLEVLHDVF